MNSIIELCHLKTLLVLEETGSVSLAVERVLLTRSVFSYQIRIPESYHDAPPFERKSSPSRLISADERLSQLTRDLLLQVAVAKHDLAHIIEGEAGGLRLAVECHTCLD